MYALHTLPPSGVHIMNARSFTFAQNHRTATHFERRPQKLHRYVCVVPLRDVWPLSSLSLVVSHFSAVKREESHRETQNGQFATNNLHNHGNSCMWSSEPGSRLPHERKTMAYFRNVRPQIASQWMYCEVLDERRVRAEKGSLAIHVSVTVRDSRHVDFSAS